MPTRIGFYLDIMSDSAYPSCAFHRAITGHHRAPRSPNALQANSLVRARNSLFSPGSRELRPVKAQEMYATRPRASFFQDSCKHKTIRLDSGKNKCFKRHCERATHFAPRTPANAGAESA